MADDLVEPKDYWAEEDLIPISAVQHYSYCPRQAALIHLEQVWDENLYTLRGRFVHEEVDQPGEELAGTVRVERSLPLWSRRWGLVGKADVVEFHGITPYPVDYKHGPRRPRTHDDLQVCAQAVCLEEMTSQSVPRGAIYHASSRRRREVEFDASLRGPLREVVAALRRALNQEALPPAPNDKRCRQCSLNSSCLPAVVAEPRRVTRLIATLFQVEEGP